VNKSSLIKRVAELVNNRVIDDIGDVRDESDRDGMRIVIELKRGAEEQIVLNQLYKHTQMQESFSMIFLAVVNGQPKEMGLIPAIQHFIDHRVEVVRRRTAYLLARAQDREHILEGYRLAKLSSDEIPNELNEIRERIAEYESILASEKKLRGVIVKELQEIKEQYGDERRTTIQDEAAEITLEDLIVDEQVAVTVTHSGYLKRTPISTYRQQRRGGSGRKRMSTREEDFLEHLFIAS